MVSPLGTNTVYVEVPPGEQKHFSNGTNKIVIMSLYLTPKHPQPFLRISIKRPSCVDLFTMVSSNTFFFELWAYHGVSLIVTYALETSLSKKSTRSLDASDSFEQ